MSDHVDLTHLRRLLAADHGLGVVSLVRPDGTVSSSVVNCGLLPHPIGGVEVFGFVMRTTAFKHRQLRLDPRLTVTVRAGWEWQAVEGTAELIGPVDAHVGSPVDVPTVLRDVFRAAGGTHSDWDEYDRVMRDEQRTAVLVTTTRVYGNVGV